MRQIVCEECRKEYDFEKDDFCPKCGAFNPPVKTWGTDSLGNFIHLDGINERDHAGSFAHSEVHKEKSARRSSGMDWNTQKTRQIRPPMQAAPQQAQPRRAESKPAPKPPRKQARPVRRKRFGFFSVLGSILWIAVILALAAFLYPVLLSFVP